MNFPQRILALSTVLLLSVACKARHASQVSASEVPGGDTKPEPWMTTVQVGQQDPFGGAVINVSTREGGARQIVSSYADTRVLEVIPFYRVTFARDGFRPLKAIIGVPDIVTPKLADKANALGLGDTAFAVVYHLYDPAQNSESSYLADLVAKPLRPIAYETIAGLPQGPSALSGDGEVVSTERWDDETVTTIRLVRAKLLAKSDTEVVVRSASGKFLQRLSLAGEGAALALELGALVDLNVKFIHRSQAPSNQVTAISPSL